MKKLVVKKGGVQAGKQGDELFKFRVVFQRSVVCTNAASMGPTIRAIVDADNPIDLSSKTISYSVKPHKFFLFNKETEERIRYEVK